MDDTPDNGVGCGDELQPLTERLQVASKALDSIRASQGSITPVQEGRYTAPADIEGFAQGLRHDLGSIGADLIDDSPMWPTADLGKMVKHLNSQLDAMNLGSPDAKPALKNAKRLLDIVQQELKLQQVIDKGPDKKRKRKRDWRPPVTKIGTQTIVSAPGGRAIQNVVLPADGVETLVQALNQVRAQLPNAELSDAAREQVLNLADAMEHETRSVVPKASKLHRLGLKLAAALRPCLPAVAQAVTAATMKALGLG